jgi:hypothetical protein
MLRERQAEFGCFTLFVAPSTVPCPRKESARMLGPGQATLQSVAISLKR